jgi:hypothetical protein
MVVALKRGGYWTLAVHAAVGPGLTESPKAIEVNRPYLTPTTR